jgi:hypothetical protein
VKEGKAFTKGEWGADFSGTVPFRWFRECLVECFQISIPMKSKQKSSRCHVQTLIMISFGSNRFPLLPSTPRFNHSLNDAPKGRFGSERKVRPVFFRK